MATVDLQATTQSLGALVIAPTAKNYPKKSDPPFSILLDNPSQCDVTFVVENKRFPSHKHVFSQGSGYFAAMLNYNFRERNKPEIELNGITPELFERVRIYLYTKDIRRVVELETVVELYQQANMFCIEEMKMDIVIYTNQEISVSTCWYIANATINILDTHKALFDCAMSWIFVNAYDAISSTCFTDADLEVAKLFLQKCLDTTVSENYRFPISYLEMYEGASKYEKKNKNHTGILTGILQQTAKASLPRRYMNGNPFLVTPEQVSSGYVWRNNVFNGDVMKVYWVDESTGFKVYFDHEDTVWYLSISPTSAPAPGITKTRVLCISLGVPKLSTPHTWLYHVRQGLSVSLLNRNRHHKLVFDQWHNYFTILDRSKTTARLVQNQGYPGWGDLLSPQGGYVGKDETGVFVRVRVSFPVDWEEAPEEKWWTKV